MCPACRRYIVVATIPAFERTRSRPVPRQVLLIYDAAGVSFVAAEGMAAYVTRLGRASIGAFAALRLDIREISWPPFTPVPGWSELIVWCRAARGCATPPILTASPAVGRALHRWDTAVSNWAEPAPFQPLPWPEERGPFLDDDVIQN